MGDETGPVVVAIVVRDDAEAREFAAAVAAGKVVYQPADNEDPYPDSWPPPRSVDQVVVAGAPRLPTPERPGQVTVNTADLRGVLLWMPDLHPGAPGEQIERLRAAVMAEADERGRQLHRELAASPDVRRYPYLHNGCDGRVHFMVTSPSRGYCTRCDADMLNRADVHQDVPETRVPALTVNERTTVYTGRRPEGVVRVEQTWQPITVDNPDGPQRVARELTLVQVQLNGETVTGQRAADLATDLLLGWPPSMRGPMFAPPDAERVWWDTPPGGSRS